MPIDIDIDIDIVYSAPPFHGFYGHHVNVTNLRQLLKDTQSKYLRWIKLETGKKH